MKYEREVVFLDRDGVINEKAEEHDYIKSVSEFRWLEGAREAIKRLNEGKFLVIIVSNQRGIARGMFSKADLEDVHGVMVKELEEMGGHIDDIYVCPHNYDANCDCRKPKIRMIEKANETWDINLKEAWMVGDSKDDILAGKGAGCRTILIKRKPGKENLASRPDFVVSDLMGAVEVIISQLHKDS